MNIFKILASGDGSINEPNVSAFLGYLLNPKADHGIGDELLKRTLHNHYKSNKVNINHLDFLIDKNEKIRNLSSNSNFNIEVLLEQAFSTDRNEKKEIVDIVVMCFEKDEQKKESLAKMVISNENRGVLRQIFLIENKIRDNATREGQLKNQYLSTISTLKDLLQKSEDEIKKILSIIFISPDAEKSNSEYEELVKDTSINIPKTQLHWSKLDDDHDDRADENESITYFLRQILKEESEGNIEAINEQTIFTIKSFIGFVDNDFKSSIEEELEGETVREIEYDFSKFKAIKKCIYSDEAWNKIEAFQNKIKTDYPSLFQRHSPTHPVSVFLKGVKDEKFERKIMSLTKTGRNICVKLVFGNAILTENQRKELIDSLSKFQNIDIKYTEKVITIKFQTFLLENIFKIFDTFYNLLLSKDYQIARESERLTI